MGKNTIATPPPTTSGIPPLELLTKSQACELLGIRPRTLDEWRAAKTIPCIARGHYVRFLRRDLEEFVMTHRVQAKPRPAQRVQAKPRPARRRQVSAATPAAV